MEVDSPAVGRVRDERRAVARQSRGSGAVEGVDAHPDPGQQVIDVADPGSITTSFLAKEPGATMRLGTAELTFRYADSFGAALELEGYERLLLDAMLGDQSLFTRSDAIERLWEISAALLEDPPQVQAYAPVGIAR